jgi:hypothetical protein
MSEALAAPVARRGEVRRGVLESPLREEGHVVTLVNKLVDQPSNYSLRTTVKLRRDALCQRCELGNTHPANLSPQN